MWEMIWQFRPSTIVLLCDFKEGKEVYVHVHVCMCMRVRACVRVCVCVCILCVWLDSSCI